LRVRLCRPVTRMTRALRLFVTCYAVAMIGIAAGEFHLEKPGWNIEPLAGLWLAVLGPAICYGLAAIGFALSGNRENAPGTFWLGFVFALALSLPGVLLLPPSPHYFDLISPFVTWSLVAVIAVLFVMGLLINRLRSENGRFFNHSRGIELPLMLMVGAAAVLSSLFLSTTYGDLGWSIVTWRNHWITDYSSVGTGALGFGPTISWLHPIFGPVGYAFHLLSLVASLAIVVLLVKSRFSGEHIAGTALFAKLTALTSLVSLWLVTDIFWGWQFNLASAPWLATLGFGCWLAALIFGAALLLPVARGETAAWRLRALVVFQLPVVAFNMLALPGYFHKGVVYLPGLAFLIVGMQIQSWACMDLLVGREKVVMVPPTAD
jgi:hypothetical protein